MNHPSESKIDSSRVMLYIDEDEYAAYCGPEMDHRVYVNGNFYDRIDPKSTKDAPFFVDINFHDSESVDTSYDFLGNISRRFREHYENEINRIADDEPYGLEHAQNNDVSDDIRHRVE